VPDAHVHRLTTSTTSAEVATDLGTHAADVEKRHRGVGLQANRVHGTGVSNGEGDAVVSSHSRRGRGDTRSSAPLPFREKDYVVIAARQGRTAGASRIGRAVLDGLPHARRRSRRHRYRNRLRETCSEHAPYRPRDFHAPPSSRRSRRRHSYNVTVRVRGGLQSYVLDRQPSTVVAGRLRLPVHVQRARVERAPALPPPPPATRTSRDRTS